MHQHRRHAPEPEPAPERPPLSRRRRWLFRIGAMVGVPALFFLALACDPDFAEAPDALGKLLLRRGDARAAADRLRSAAQLKPGLPGIQEALHVAQKALEGR